MTTRTGLALMLLLMIAAAGTAADPTGSAAAVKRADDSWAKQDLNSALRDLDEAVRLDPNNAEAWWRRGRV